MSLMIFYFLSMILSIFQQPQLSPKFDSVCVYDYYTARGFTTTGALSKFKEIEQEKYKKRAINVEIFNNILGRAQIKKHAQKKLGAQPQLFCIGEQGTKRYHLLINPPVIVDLTDKKEYWIKNKDDRKWIENLIKIEFEVSREKE